MILWSYTYQRHGQILKVFHLPRPRNKPSHKSFSKEKEARNYVFRAGGPRSVWSLETSLNLSNASAILNHYSWGKVSIFSPPRWQLKWKYINTSKHTQKKLTGRNIRYTRKDLDTSCLKATIKIRKHTERSYKKEAQQVFITFQHIYCNQYSFTWEEWSEMNV